MTSLIDQTLVFIGSAIIMVPLFHKIGLGSVLGYLIAGILVGPFGLAFIKDSNSVLHFAELGVVFLLFIIGLEIQPLKLWSMKKKLIGLGGMQILLCTTLFTIIISYLGLALPSAIIISLGLSLSSTAFAIQTLTEKNQFNTEFGRSSFSILLMQDLVAIPALAIIPLFALESNQTSASGSLNLITFVGIVVSLIAASRFLLRPVFRIIASTRTREIFTATALFIVLGVATLMQKIGLSAALGTFLAGVLLADSEYRHELEANLEPFKNLLMGLFFIAVGMGVSIDLILAKPLLVFSLAIGYLIIKMLVIYASGRMNKMDHENSKLMAINIAQGGEFAFVIFSMVTLFKLAPDDLILLLTAVISLSMALNPLIGIINDRMILRCSKNKGQAAPVYDQIKNESPDVIIAGLGRFGQMFARILKTQNIGFVAIDHDSEHVEELRRFGNKAYYGDARREDILHAAGAAKAKYFILAIDDVEASLECAQTVLEHFPHLKIFARARNRGHAFDLMESGITHIKRETLDSSLNFAKDLFIEMGFEKNKAFDLVEKFRVHDEIMLIEQFKVRKDDKMYISVSNQAAAQFAEVLQSENTQSYIDLNGSSNYTDKTH
jgi:monovalent cation:proton antiporter-2 (CPA2) family protein